MPEDVMPIDSAEIAVPFQGPAVSVNRFYIHVGPSVRLSFAEQGIPGDPPLFRAAVSMSHADAIALAKALRSMLSEIEKQLEKQLDQTINAALDKHV